MRRNHGRKHQTTNRLHRHQSSTAYPSGDSPQQWKQQRIPFLELPPEIRNMIYTLLYQDAKGILISLSMAKQFDDDTEEPGHKASETLANVLALSRTCTTVCRELLPMFLAENRFHIDYSSYTTYILKGNFSLPMPGTHRLTSGRRLQALQPGVLNLLVQAGAHIRDLSISVLTKVNYRPDLYETVEWRIRVAESMWRVTIKRVRGSRRSRRSIQLPFRESKLAPYLQVMLTGMLAGRAKPGLLGVEELEVIREVASQYHGGIVASL
ncbi:hypothetical protein BDV97DRAFT_364485 [Delphinella strobiligena]|nr:hypothetical protein BDV97DRAFT_364485 [Delphinella strobiligena]